MVSGGQCVMMAGQTLTLKWCVDSLVTGNVKDARFHTVYFLFFALKLNYVFLCVSECTNAYCFAG